MVRWVSWKARMVRSRWPLMSSRLSGGAASNLAFRVGDGVAECVLAMGELLDAVDEHAAFVVGLIDQCAEQGGCGFRSVGLLEGFPCRP